MYNVHTQQLHTYISVNSFTLLQFMTKIFLMILFGNYNNTLFYYCIHVFKHPRLLNQLSYIREYGSTLYVGLAHAFPPTNTKFKPLLLPTQTVRPYRNTHKHRTSHFWVQLSSGSLFLPPDKNRKFLRFLHHQYNI